MAHCPSKRVLTDHLNAVAENIMAHYTVIDTREVDEMLKAGGSPKPYRHRYLVANRVKAQGWRCYYAMRKNEKGYLFFWQKAGSKRCTLEEYCERHGGRPATLEPWTDRSRDESAWTLRWKPMIDASKDLTAYFFGLRDYYRAQAAC